MATPSQESALFSVGILPFLMGLGHLAPAMGAVYSATGEYQVHGAVLGMVGTAAALVDSYDHYKDIPVARRPSKWIWKPWIYSMWAVVFYCTFYSGLQTAIQMYRFSLIGLFWGTPCIPHFSSAEGLHLFKPKSLFREAKSLVVAVCMAYVTADTTMFYLCHDKNSQCTEQSIRTRSLCLAVLYQFFRETACDARDIADDIRDGMRTLPVRLGKSNTLLLMAGLGSLADAMITKGIWATPSAGVQVNPELLAGSVFRVCAMMGAYAVILKYPRDNYVAWGIMSLFGLTPVLWAQTALLEGV